MQVTLGSPALGKGAEIKPESFAYPLKAAIENHTRRAFSMPEIKLRLPALGTDFEVVFRDQGQLARFVTDMHALSELSAYEKAVTISFQVTESGTADSGDVETEHSETATVDAPSGTPAVVRRGRPPKPQAATGETN